MSGLIPVYLQNVEEGRSVLFCEQWPADQLDEAFRLLRMWGVSDAGGDDLDAGGAVGEFCIEEGRAFFRITLAPHGFGADT